MVPFRRLSGWPLLCFMRVRGWRNISFAAVVLLATYYRSPPLTRSVPQRLKAILEEWETRVARCFTEAQAQGVIPQDASPEKLARVFWSGWEGAVMRAKLFQSADPLNQYWEFFLYSITQK
jgi:hypothetical protein